MGDGDDECGQLQLALRPPHHRCRLASLPATSAAVLFTQHVSQPQSHLLTNAMIGLKSQSEVFCQIFYRLLKSLKVYKSVIVQRGPQHGYSPLRCHNRPPPHLIVCSPSFVKISSAARRAAPPLPRTAVITNPPPCLGSHCNCSKLLIPAELANATIFTTSFCIEHVEERNLK